MIAYTNYLYDGRVRLEAETLVGWGHEVLVLVPKDKPAPPRRSYVHHGVAVRELNVPKYQGKSTLTYVLSYFRFLVFAFFACTWLYLRSRIDVVHVHNMPNSLVFAAIVPRLFGARVILDIHDTVPETYAAKFRTSSSLIFRILRLEEGISCRLPQRLIAVNHVQREALLGRGIPAEKVATVIYMPQFAAQNANGNGHNLPGAFRMVNHGTISLRLGNDLLVQAAAKLVHEIPGFELHFVGGGDGLQDLIRLSKSLDVENCVHFHKAVEASLLPQRLAGMDVGIVANRRNIATELMLPAKLIDYVNLGIPALVPRLKGIQYYFTNDMVSYFEPGNVDSIVEATVALYKDKARRAQQPLNAKSFVQKYGWDNAKMSLKAIYEDS